MDRSNYNNRGGYDNRGGGRNTGGGRGDYGRGGRGGGGRGNWNQPQPQQYGNQEQHGQKCQYNLLRGIFVTAKPLERWGLIDFTRGHRDWIDLEDFIPKLKNRCTNLGVIMEEPLYVHRTNMRDLSNVNAVSRLLNWFVEECRKVDKGRLQMIICVMPERHDGYKIIKHVSELEIGVMTQCCLSPNANKSNNDQFLANLGLKINVKLNGSNVELVERFPHFNPN